MSNTGIHVETPEGTDALTEFIAFYDRVYEYRSARWLANRELQLAILSGESPLVRNRRLRPFVVREGGDVVARTLAVIDESHNAQLNERVGSVSMFEAMPEARDATKLLMGSACQWLQEQGAEAARAGFGFMGSPFVMDEYELLPPSQSRQNPPYYHRLLKEAGFAVEWGMVDYKRKATPKFYNLCLEYLATMRKEGYEVIPLTEIPQDRIAADLEKTWNDAFAGYLGGQPFTTEGAVHLVNYYRLVGGLDVSGFAYHGSDLCGVVLALPPSIRGAYLKPGRILQDDERINNFCGRGTVPAFRRAGVSRLLGAFCTSQLIARGAAYISYNRTRDDNWTIRREAESLGARVWANYLVYKRPLTNNGK